MLNGKELTMIRLRDRSWLRTTPLLLALMAGVVATQLVPPYRDIAYALKEGAKSSPASPGQNSSGMTGVDVDLRHLQFATSIG
jgi:hypothetical protein